MQPNRDVSNNPMLNLFNMFNMLNTSDNSGNTAGPFERNVESNISPEFNEIFNILTNPDVGNMLVRRRRLRNILDESFNMRPKFKKIITEKGKETLKIVTYSKELNVNEACPIWQVDFEEGQEITLSPCNHAFTKGAVEKWLEKEKPECPICRYQFDYKEVRIKKKESRIEEIDEPEGRGQEGGGNENAGNEIIEDNELADLRSSRTNLLDSLARAHPFGRNQLENTIPHSYLANMISERDEEEDIRHAIALSMMDQQNNDISNNNGEDVVD